MPVKNIAQPFNIFNSVSVSATQTFTSSNSSVKYLDTVGYQFNLSGTPTGVLQINGSLDYNPVLPQSADPINGSLSGTWTTIASVSVSSGTPSPVFFNMNQLGFAWIQSQFISSTATGTLSGWICGKSLG